MDNDPLESLAQRIAHMHGALEASQKIQNALVERAERQGGETPFTLFERHALLDQQLRRSRQALRHARRALEHERSHHQQTLRQQRVESLRHHTIVEHASDAILQVNGEGDILYSNPAAHKLFGYDEAALAKTPLSTLFPNQHQSRSQSVTLSLRQDAGHDHALAWTALRNDGGLIDVGAFISPVEAEDQALYTLILHDLSLQLRLHQAQEESRDQALTSDRIWTQLLDRMTEQLRTPLHNLAGLLELLQSNPQKAAQQGYLESARTTVSELLQQLQMLPNHTTLLSAPLAGERLTFDLLQMLEGTTRQWASVAQQKGLQLLCMVPPQLPAIWEGDLTRLRQVVGGLLERSVGATQQGTVCLSLHAQQQPNSSWYELEICIADSRPPMQTEQMIALQQFLRQEGQAGPLHDGAETLSLAIIRQLAGFMRGRLEFAFDHERGESRFILSLPLLPGPQPSQPLTRELLGRRILILEPYPAYANYLATLCQQWGMVAHSTSSEAQAIATWQGLQQLGMLPEFMLAPPANPDQPAPWRDAPAGTLHLLTLTRGPTPNQPASLCKPLSRQALYEALTQQRQDAPAASPALPSHITNPLRQDRLLLVEDNPINQKVALGMLKRFGFQATVVDRGAKALQAVKEHPFDLILMDIQMPEMDGYATTAAIRHWERESGTPRQPISALTANAMSGDRELCLAADMDDYLSKPLKQEALWDLLKRWLNDLPEHPPMLERSPLAEPATLAPPLPAAKPAEKPVEAEPASNPTTRCLDHGKLDELERMMSVMENGFQELLSRYLSDTPVLLQNLAAAVEAQDAKQARQLAHNLKSTSASLGAKLLSVQAQQIEALSKQGQTALIPPLLPDLLHHFQQAAREMAQRLSLTSSGSGDVPQSQKACVSANFNTALG
ncbi:PAS/PAC sensor hybrid histidine kinase [Magnetococcus marinus MC-1]|uniref:PAS/PAC sensor hybrid histidine kinase n=1 Tax=Magnetococcus marinus (strain ATCC BAA-1437 / JCM 17883 / MC-1) TaxID=156889 RepID=A0LAI7_MAGMM|nr:response regulator [Magnetococcus marinus]ABK44980.1 PAS/PAC sensor hybrid histidine kinase [Magnetococcus marinus MC-1]